MNINLVAGANALDATCLINHQTIPPNNTNNTTAPRIKNGVSGSALPKALYRFVSTSTNRYGIEKAANPSSPSVTTPMIKGQPFSKPKKVPANTSPKPKATLRTLRPRRAPTTRFNGRVYIEINLENKKSFINRRSTTSSTS